MKNTLLPLTIAFIADDGRIVNLADMQPQSEESHCSAEPVRFALEMNQGWFAKRGIKPGFKLQGPALRAPERPRNARFAVQPKLRCAKSQLTSLSRKVSTNFGRRLR